MRNVKFYFTDPVDDPRIRSAAEEILQSLSKAHPFDVDGELLIDKGIVLGIALAGEHEMVSMASEFVRKSLKSRGLHYREEYASEPGGGAANAHSLLESIASRSSQAPSQADKSAEPAADEDEEEYEEYDLEDVSRAEYGRYPLTGTRGRREEQKRGREHDGLLPAVRETLASRAFGLSGRKPISAEDRRRLVFVRGIRSGMAFYRMGLFEDAERNLGAAMKVNRSDPEVHFYLGLVYDQLRKPDLSERHFRRAIALDPDVGANHFYLGNVYQKLGRFDKAIEEYKRSLEQDPDIPIVYNNLAWVFYQSTDYERATRTFEQAITLSPDLPFPHNGLACVYQELGAFHDAVAEFKKAIELYPGYAAAHLKLGWCMLQLGEVAQAIEEFNAVLESSDDSEYAVSANYSLGHSYLALGKLFEAQESFQKVVAQEDEEFVDAILHLGIIQLRLGFGRQAVALLRRYLRKAGDEGSDEAWRYLAHAYFQADQYGAAMRACRRALQHEADDSDIYELMGQIAGAQERWMAAERHLRKSLDLNRDSPSAWLHLGWVFENRGDPAQAVQAYRNAIQRDPESAESYNALGHLYTEQGKRDEALVLFEKALELSPSDVGVLNNLGWLYTQLGQYGNALPVYQKALQVEPENVMLRCNVGALYLQMGRRDEAERELRQVLVLGTDEQATANAHYFLGLVARARQNQKKVIEHMEEALRHAPDLGAAYFRLGESLLEEGELVEARCALERYLELDPQGEFAGTARQYVLERLAGVSIPKRTLIGRVPARQIKGSTTRRRKRTAVPTRRDVHGSTDGP